MAQSDPDTIPWSVEDWYISGTFTGYRVARYRWVPNANSLRVDGLLLEHEVASGFIVNRYQPGAADKMHREAITDCEWRNSSLRAG